MFSMHNNLLIRFRSRIILLSPLIPNQENPVCFQENHVTRRKKIFLSLQLVHTQISKIRRLENLCQTYLLDDENIILFVLYASDFSVAIYRARKHKYDLPCYFVRAWSFLLILWELCPYLSANRYLSVYAKFNTFPQYCWPNPLCILNYRILTWCRCHRWSIMSYAEDTVLIPLRVFESKVNMIPFLIT